MTRKNAPVLESLQATISSTTPTTALTRLVTFTGSVPNIQEVSLIIDYDAHPEAEKELTRLTRRVGLERLDLSSTHIPFQILKPFFRHLHHRLSNSITSLRHLSICSDADSRTAEAAILSLVKLGRNGLEYLDFRESEFLFERVETLEPLVDAVQKSNLTLQGLWLLPREDWDGSHEDDQRGRLNELLKENRIYRTSTHQAAFSLLLPSRIVFHSRPVSTSPSSSSQHQLTVKTPPSIATLPSELLFEILKHLVETRGYVDSALSDIQVLKVLGYAEDRRTVDVGAGGTAARSRRALLAKMDCWR
ncbi:hypothetical protein BDY24DRAFT_415271 [Mrakia frigida]|uniref:uncharacterized protein n=1 Tax=Mrakia frigida TaxID=29902 RepID=UPI003FCC0A90